MGKEKKHKLKETQMQALKVAILQVQRAKNIYEAAFRDQGETVALILKELGYKAPEDYDLELNPELQAVGCVKVRPKTEDK